MNFFGAVGDREVSRLVILQRSLNPGMGFQKPVPHIVLHDEIIVSQ